MSQVAAFFDVDGTLTTGHLYGSVIKQRMRDPLGMLRASLYLASHFAMVVPYRIGMLDKTRFFISWGEDLAPLYKSVRLEKAEPEWQAVAEDLLSEQREAVVELLRKHQSEGHMVVLVSGTFQPVLRIMAGRLGVQHFVGTPLAEKNGRYTGRLSAPMYFAGEKARQLKMYVERNGLDVDMTASYAYADRMYDRAFLEMVGYPVAVYPDEPLLAHAREKGWQVIGEMSA